MCSSPGICGSYIYSGQIFGIIGFIVIIPYNGGQILQRDFSYEIDYRTTFPITRGCIPITGLPGFSLHVQSDDLILSRYSVKVTAERERMYG